MNSSWIIPGLLTAGAGVVAVLASKRLWAAVDTPTIPTGNVVLGRVEVHGKAGPGPDRLPVISPFDATPCAYWKVQVQTEVGSGKNKSWKTKHEAVSTDWITIDDGSGPVNARITGATLQSIDSVTTPDSDLPASITSLHLTEIARGQPYLPNNSNVRERSLFDRVVTGIGAFAIDVPISSIGGKYRVVETRIPVGSDLYVIGTTRYEELAHTAVLEHQQGKPLYIYGGTEEQLARNSRLVSWAATAALFVLAWIAVAYLRGRVGYTSSGKQKVTPNWRAGTIGPWFALLFVLVTQAIRIRNRVVATAEQVIAGKRLVDVALAKRSTLIPQLTEVVRAAAAHERNVQESLAALRAESTDDAGPKVIALAEHYPMLKTNENFLALQRAIADVENDLAVARGFEAAAVAAHRTRVESFPDSWLAPTVATA